MKKYVFVLLAMLVAQVFAANIQVAEGKDYEVLSIPVPALKVPKGKVHVIEFFSYNCIHCKAVEPLLKQKLATDKKIVLDTIQIVYDEKYSSAFAKIHATIKLLKLEKLESAVFTAAMAQKDFNNMDQLKQFLVQNGLNQKQVDSFIDTYNSFTVNGKVNEYKQLTTRYNITQSPVFIVADQYLIKPAQPERLVQVTQALVNKIANSKSKK